MTDPVWTNERIDERIDERISAYIFNGHTARGLARRVSYGVRDEYEAARQQDAFQIATQAKALDLACGEQIRLEAALAAERDANAKLTARVAVMHQVGRLAERDHQNALSRLVTKKHEEEIAKLQAQLAASHKRESDVEIAWASALAELVEAQEWEDVPINTDALNSIGARWSVCDDGEIAVAYPGMGVRAPLPVDWRLQRRAPVAGEATS